MHPRMQEFLLGKGRTWTLYAATGAVIGIMHYFPTEVLGAASRWKRAMLQDVIDSAGGPPAASRHRVSDFFSRTMLCGVALALRRPSRNEHLPKQRHA